MDRRLEELSKIYCEEHVWAADPEAVPRVMTAVNAYSELAVIGEAVGPRTLRVSGVSYFDRKGKIGYTGKYLDTILNAVGYTVYPPCNVDVPDGMIRSGPGRGKKTAYFSDLCPVFPGYQQTRRGRLKVRRPSQESISSALAHNFLARELCVVKPRVILLLGKQAYSAVYSNILRVRPAETLSAVMQKITQITIHSYMGALVIPVLHPSPASPAFLKWFQPLPASRSYESFIDLLNSCLGD